MPKKDVSAISGTAQAQQDAASEGIDAYELPKSLVTRLARSALPENAKMQKEMVLALTKGSTVFVNYLAATAHDIASQKQHKSVSATDVLKALEEIDMGDMIPKLEQDLQAYRANQKTSGKRVSAKDKAAQDPSAAGKGKQRAGTADAGGKGKERATIVLPSRGVPGQENTLSILEPEADGDREEEGDEEGEDEEMVDADDAEVDGAEDVDEEEDDEGDDDQIEGEEPVEDVGLEDDELRRDGRGVEEQSQDMDDED